MGRFGQLPDDEPPRHRDLTMAAMDDITHPNEHDAYREAVEEYYRQAAVSDAHKTSTHPDVPRVALLGLLLAVLVAFAGYNAGFNDGQTHVLDLVCQVAGQSFDAASKICIDQ